MGTMEVGGTSVPLRGARGPIDVLIVLALEDELDAVIAESGGPAAWQPVRDRDGLAYHVCELPNADGKLLGIAAAWTGALGTTATAARAAALIHELQPTCVAMCGICAGKRGEVALGDVIVADRIYSFDHGKLVAAHDGAPQAFFHDLTMYNLERTWHMDAAAFRRDHSWAAHLLPRRPPHKAVQQRWLLHATYAHQYEHGPAPVSHPERAAVFRIDAAHGPASDWADRIRELREQKLVTLEAGALKLTELGRQAIDEDRVLYPEGLPGEPPFAVHVGPIATGNAVIEDPSMFERLKHLGRKTLGLEMEAFAIGYLGNAFPRRVIVAKAVSDHGDHDKDDRFRDFACRASAAWLLAFLHRHIRPKVPIARAETADLADLGPPSPFPDLELAHDARASAHASVTDSAAPTRIMAADGHGYQLGDFYRRVQRALQLRLPDARLVWKRGPVEIAGALREFLEVRTRSGGYTRIYPVAVIEGLDLPALDGFIEHIVKRYRVDTPYLEAQLFHGGEAPDHRVLEEARRRGVRIESALELEGLLDFRPYVAEQTRVLERNTVYPSPLYVRQGLSYGAGRGEQSTDDALRALDQWLCDDGPQLVLVLGDFGTGKTFLMHELALRLGRRDGATVPILVELRKLEKTRSLDALLGQHFIPERGMRRFDYHAFRYMLEEGRVVLLFDGFDELALRVTYETAADHLDTILQAAIGKAKVVITSRTQHFINDQQVMNALGERVLQRGFRMARLLPFDEFRIRQFLSNRFNNDAVAGRWFDLLGEVKDLRGLSHNPRMLSFIAEIPEQDLRRAAAGGEITSATLYRVLIDKWLGHEVRRDHPAGLSTGSRRKAVTDLAVLLWPRKERAIAISEIPPLILEEVARLAERPLGPDAVAHKLGSGTLLVRDEEGRLSFIHQSVIEWLVANAAVDDLRNGRDCALLAHAEISDLMADFLTTLAGSEAVQSWATRCRATASSEIAIANAHRLLRRLHIATDDDPMPGAFDGPLDMSSQDLRGQDFSATSYLRAGLLRGSDLSEAQLVRADLSEAVLVKSRLQRANLERANLRDTDLRSADLSFARLLGADLTGARLGHTSLRYAKLVGARLDPHALVGADAHGAALARPGRFELDQGLPAATCTSIAWSPDGVILALGYRDGTVVLADATTGRSVRRLESHPYAVNCIAFSPDGKRLATGSDDHTVRLWVPENGTLLHSLEHHDDRVTCLAFSPDGERLASGSDDRFIALWKPSSGTHVMSLEAHEYSITGVAFSADSKVLAAATALTVDLWDIEVGVRLRTLSGHFGEVTSVAMAPAGDLVASGSFDRTVLVWNGATGARLWSLSAHPGAVVAVAFSHDGKTLASSADRIARLWSPTTGDLVREIVSDAKICSLALSPDNRLLAAGCEDQVVRIWSHETGLLVRSLSGQSDWVHCVAVSPDGQCFASGARDRSVRIWDLTIRPRVPPLQLHSSWVNSVAYSPDGKLLASGSSDHSIRLWNVATETPVHALDGHLGCVNSVAFSPDGAHVASGSDDETVRIWRVATGERVQLLKGHTRRVNSIAFSPDKNLLASGSDDHTVRLWDPMAGTLIRSLRGHSAWVNRIAFSPDGRVLASGSEDKTVRLWNPETGALRRLLMEGSACVSSIAFSPDSKLLAAGSFKTVQLWDPDQGRRLRALEIHSHWINSIAFSPDGKLLITASSDGTIQIWSVSSVLRGDDRERCLAVVVPGRGGWTALAADGRYKLGGNATGLAGFTVGLCRFDPGELDAYPDAFDGAPRRIPDDEPLFVA